MKTLITPELAKNILENNNINRKVVKANLSFLTREMKDGRFVYNGESIIISSLNNLMDGQHRLMAIIASGKSIYMNLVQGVEEIAMATIDTGATRTAGSVFSIANVSSSNNMASMVKRIMEKIDTERITDSSGTIKLSNQELLDFYNNDSERLLSMFGFCNNLYQTNIKFSTPALLSAYLYLFSLEDKRAKSFIRELITGNRETESNAVIKLRDKMINNKISVNKYSKTYERDLIIYTWRKYIDGKDISHFSKKIKMSFLKGDIRELKSKLSCDDL